MTQSDREAYPKTNFRLFIKLLQVVETQKYWFAARTLSKQEFAVKKRIENLNLEEGIDVECYLPTRTVISQLKYRLKDFSTHSMLVVPDKQMQDFMFVMDLNPEGVCFDNEPLTVGKKVTVVKGEFSGIEGEIATEANKTYVVIRITGVLVASIKVPKSYLKAIND